MSAPSMQRLRRACYLVLAAGTAVLDLWSKTGGTLAGDPSRWPFKYPGGPANFDAALQPTNYAVVENWIYVQTKWNPGAAWSLQLPSSLLLWGTALAVPAIALWIFWPARLRVLDGLAKALVLGGAIGNLYDRWRWGQVRDFIDVCFGRTDGWHYPTFNVADAALVVGIAILLLGGLRKRPPEAA